MEPSTIVGIIGHMHGSWVGWDKLDNVVIQPGHRDFQRPSRRSGRAPNLHNRNPAIEQTVE
jgi:hypothetical protein